MSSLVRTKTGAFSEKDTVQFDMLEKAAAANELQTMLLPIAAGLEHLDTLEADETMRKRVLHGQKNF
ncbi:hypothetical protein RWE15_21340 [Virgibacillus halophilus]|uniref:Uncharacterized protein n=1 Tax=Tigheibacillus halophilus TaxID=361280 RepID=A0ABU5CAQ5_9BACI|nr:hypothetical protein [Virgibacillus halophilus]